jgi:hypothetical protein
MWRPLRPQPGPLKQMGCRDDSATCSVIISSCSTLHRNRSKKHNENKDATDGGRALYQYEDVATTGNDAGLLHLNYCIAALMKGLSPQHCSSFVESTVVPLRRSTYEPNGSTGYAPPKRGSAEWKLDVSYSVNDGMRNAVQHHRARSNLPTIRSFRLVIGGASYLAMSKGSQRVRRRLLLV